MQSLFLLQYARLVDMVEVALVSVRVSMVHVIVRMDIAIVTLGGLENIVINVCFILLFYISFISYFSPRWDPMNPFKSATVCACPNAI
jgi:hypothetical protein